MLDYNSLSLSIILIQQESWQFHCPGWCSSHFTFPIRKLLPAHSPYSSLAAPLQTHSNCSSRLTVNPNLNPTTKNNHNLRIILPHMAMVMSTGYYPGKRLLQPRSLHGPHFPLGAPFQTHCCCSFPGSLFLSTPKPNFYLGWASKKGSQLQSRWKISQDTVLSIDYTSVTSLVIGFY